jgi:hypothetical protein
MRTRLRSKISLLVVMCTVLIAVPAVAFAADVINADLIDFNSQNATYTAGDANGVRTDYWIVADNDGCDPADGGALSFKLKATRQSDNTVVTSSSFKARLSTAAVGSEQTLNNFTLTFDKCSTAANNQAPNNTQTVIFTSAANLAPGQYKIEVDTSAASINDSNDPDNTYSASNQNSFLINVSAPAVTDADGDGVADGSDNCPSTANPGQADADNDGQGDACDATPNGPDPDGDGFGNLVDNCDNVANPAQTDTDGDGAGDACDSQDNRDSDSDGVQNYQDNCPAVANPAQTDTDSDGQGDACDNQDNRDSDNDGVQNYQDNCPSTANPGQADTDGDGQGDACDQPAAPTLSLATASDLGSSPSDKITKDDTPTFVGTAQAGHQVKVYDGSGTTDVLLGTVTADASDDWSFTVGGPGSAQGVTKLNDGTYTIKATASNSALTSGATSLSDVEIDTQKPGFNCPAADTDWHPDNQTFTCTAFDNTGGSGLAANQGLGANNSFELSTSVADGFENANASTGTKTLTDIAGNSATAGPISGIQVDRKAPVVGCGSADGDWHDNNVSIGCTAADGGSGLADSNEASFSLSTTVADGQETANASTGTHEVADAVGNKATAGPISGNMIDRKAPTFSCDLAPTGWQPNNVSISCTAADGGSGLAANQGLGANNSFELSTSVADGFENANASTGTKTLTDSVGHTATAGPISGIQIDRKAPSISNVSAVTGVSPGFNPSTNYLADTWTNKDVKVSWACSDAGSGPASASPFQTFSDEGATGSVTPSCDDNVGNSATGTAFSPIKIDKTKPTVSVVGFNDGAVFTTTDTLPNVGCNVTDNLSGAVNSSPAAVKTKDTRTTNGTGSVTYTCTGTDNASNSDTASKSFSVIHTGASGILQPINPDNTSVFSRGRAVPVKFQLAGDGAGTSFPNGFNTSGWKLERIQVNCSSGFDLADAVVESVPSNTPSTVFRYDSTADQYIYNADFSNKAAGTCWRVKATLDDNTTVLTSAVFRLQK